MNFTVITCVVGFKFRLIVWIKIVLSFLALCEALLILAKCKVHMSNPSASRGLASHVFLVLCPRCFLTFADPDLSKVASGLAFVVEETQPPITSVCEAAPKSLFCTPNLVPGSWYAS